MTHIVLEHTRTTKPNRNAWSFTPSARIQATESELPPKPQAVEECCPHCQQAMHDTRRNTIQRLGAAFAQLLGAATIILFSIIRLGRLAIAVALSLVGVIGFGVHNLAMFVVHPDDRRLLPGGSSDRLDQQ